MVYSEDVFVNSTELEATAAASLGLYPVIIITQWSLVARLVGTELPRALPFVSAKEVHLPVPCVLERVQCVLW